MLDSKIPVHEDRLVTLQEVFAKVLREKVDQITDESDSKRHKRWDSFNHMQLVVAIEEAYKVKLTTAEIESMKTFKIAKDILREKGVAL